MSARGFLWMLMMVPTMVLAQKPKWEQTSVNFGAVADWNSPEAVFRFTNTGNKRLMFLPQKHERDVLVVYPQQAFEPGETGQITIRYYTSDTGPFSRTVRVYHNGSDKAEELVLKGNIKSIYADALTACPSFTDPPPVRTSEPNVVQVVDAESKTPLPNAVVEVYDRGIRKAVNRTNRDGVAVNWIQLGNYIAIASKDGYDRVEQEAVFTKRDRTVVVYLKKTEPTELSDTRYQRSEKAEEEVDLGITTNILLEEDASQLEQMDLGVTTNDQWKESEEIPDVRDQTSERVEPEMDLGISTNEQFDERPVDIVVEETAPAQQTPEAMEETIEAALAEAEPSPVNRQPPTEPEPEFSTEKFKPNNILLLLDVSGSMKDDGKMDRLKSSVRRLVMMLREVDVLTIIAYNSDSWEVLPPTPVTDNAGIVALVDSLQPFGYTNGVKGMETAYARLLQQQIEGGNNQLIIATDGKFNSSKFSESEAADIVRTHADKGIALSIIGFGDDREAGRLMRKLADLGSGRFVAVTATQDPTELLAQEIKQRSLKN
jgi:Mg-chelatase subunit ChlD